MDESVESQELDECGSTVTELEVGVIAQGQNSMNLSQVVELLTVDSNTHYSLVI